MRKLSQTGTESHRRRSRRHATACMGRWVDAFNLHDCGYILYPCFFGVNLPPEDHVGYMKQHSDRDQFDTPELCSNRLWAQ
jgi:hypothetical protein